MQLPGRPDSGAAEPACPLGKLVGEMLHLLRDGIEERVDGDETRPPHVPVRLLELGVEVDRGRQIAIQKLDRLTANIL